MKTQLVKRVGVALGACVLAARCDGGPTAPRPQAPPPPPPPRTLAPLAGAYTLTVQLADECSALPDVLKRRTYRANLEASAYAYLGIRISGGGFAEPTGTGDLWPAGVDQVSINWNNFDIGGCDGYPEPVSDDSTLMICGTGSGVVNGTTISLRLNGEVFMEAAGRRQRVCRGLHEFTFLRSTE